MWRNCIHTELFFLHSKNVNITQLFYTNNKFTTWKLCICAIIFLHRTHPKMLGSFSWKDYKTHTHTHKHKKTHFKLGSSYSAGNVHQFDISSVSSCLSSGSTTSSEKIKLFTALKMLAICITTIWELVVVGRTDTGRGGIHIGWNSFLLKVGAYSVRTAWQKRNLQETPRLVFLT